MKKISLFIILIGAALSLCWSIYRDSQIEKLNPPDLRNRVVGARLQKDGKLPYFYKWKATDGLRYYDPYNFDTFKVSNITASPYFNELLYPIIEMPERTISHLWLYLQYVLLFIMIGIALSFTVTDLQKIAIIIVAASFLFTDAWIRLIATGQFYLFIPFLAMLFYYFFGKSKNVFAPLLAGLCAISLVLIRPNAVFIFLPFLLIVSRYSTRFKIVFFVPIILLLAYTIGNAHQRELWGNYNRSLSEQLKIHQKLGPAVQENEKDPGFTSVEGWDNAEIEKDNAKFHPTALTENGNVFVLVKKIFNINLSTTFLTVISLLLIFIILILFYFFRRKSGFDIYNIAILGFCLYMISDLFSPFYRHQYYTVQWFFPLLLAAAGFVKNYKTAYLAILTGLILNIISWHLIKMEHTLGEYIIFVALLLLAFIYKNPSQLNNEPSSLLLKK